ncbi:hypothetical protein [Cystobacter fuscus]|uniref:hypothetical protein n=1 Tax=Cystobacter fuscus TaxID=43 RepID=UPI0037BFDCC1
MSQFWTLTGDFSDYIVVLARDRALLAGYPRASPSAIKDRLGFWAENKKEREILEKIYAALPGNAVKVSKKTAVQVSTLKTALDKAFLYGDLLASEVKYPFAVLGEVVVRAADKGKRTAPINKPGFIDSDDGSNIRTGPWELGGQLVRTKPLPPATPVFVSGPHPDKPEWWYVTAYAKDGIFRGYVQGFRVNVDLPEPTARLHQLEEGDTAEGLAVKMFSSSVRKGHDLHFYENVLLYVNQLKKRPGITGTYRDPSYFDIVFGDTRSNIKLIKKERIWLVSPAFAKTLEGVVPSGSLTGGMVADLKELAAAIERGIKRAAQSVVDVLKSITDSPKYIDKILREDAKVIRENLDQILGVIALFLLAEGVSALLAATPTLIGQLVAIGIQLVLAALGAAALAEGLVTAAEYGAEWLRLAIHAGGKAEDIALASEEFLKMLQAIALAALSYMGVKGNWNKAVKLGNSLPPPSAMAVAIAPNGTRVVVGTARPITGVAIVPPGASGPLGAADAVKMQAEKNGGSSSKSPKANEEAPVKKADEEAAAEKAKDAAAKQATEIAAERAKWRKHVHEGDIKLDPQSPYHQKWDGNGLHSWEGVLKVCKRDGFNVEHVIQDPVTGVRRIKLRRSGIHPKTKKPVSGLEDKTIYPKDLTLTQIDAAGEAALEAAVQKNPGTSWSPPGNTIKAGQVVPVNGYFKAQVKVGNPPRTLEIEGWYIEASNGTKIIRSHAPKYDMNWPAVAPKDY